MNLFPLKWGLEKGKNKQEETLLRKTVSRCLKSYFFFLFFTETLKLCSKNKKQLMKGSLCRQEQNELSVWRR